MGTKPIRVPETLYSEVQELADEHDTSMGRILDEVWVQADVDELEAGNGAPSLGRCPDCEYEFTGDEVETGVLTGATWVTCPNAERDGDVHEDGRFDLSELDEA